MTTENLKSALEYAVELSIMMPTNISKLTSTI